MRSHWIPIFLLILVSVLLGFGAWLTRFPDSPILDRMESWPVVGEHAAKFRDLYSPPPPPPAEEEPSFLPGDTIHVQAAQNIWVLAGFTLHREANKGSEVLYTARSVSKWMRLGKDGDWIQARIPSTEVTGWVHLPGYDERDPPLGTAPDPPGPLWPRSPKPEYFKKAKALFEGREQSLDIGPFTLLTDVDLDQKIPKNLIAAFTTLANQTEPVYAERYGLSPVGKPKEAILFYNDEQDYRRAQELSPSLHGMSSTGHTGYGMVFLFLGDRRADQVKGTLVHELCHLLNRRSLGPALPPWLDEGMADDLSAGKLGRDGVYRPEQLYGLKLNWGDHITYEGPFASLLSLQSAIGRGDLPALAELVDYDWQTFMSGNSRLHYDVAAFFVRFLLSTNAPDGTPRKEGFQLFLQSVAEGKAVSGGRLQAALDEPWPELDEAFRLWIEQEARALGPGVNP